MFVKEISNKSQALLDAEERLGESIETYLRRRFVDDNIHLHDLHKEVGIAYPTLIKTLKRAGVYGRRLGICSADIRNE